MFTSAVVLSGCAVYDAIFSKIPPNSKLLVLYNN